ncbi:MAG: serine hydrolase [Lewinella sp.]|nr:serine hydrolase [Lewinella sp.]
MKPAYLLGALLLTLTSCHVGRFFLYNFADINDKHKFPSLPIDNDPTQVFQFVELPPDSVDQRVPTMLEEDDRPVSFEDFLVDHKTVALLIIKSDTIVYEQYFGRYEQATDHPSFSVAKSFVSALVGIAIAEGHIDSAGQSITEFLDYLPAEEFGPITIQHLLDMQSGIDFNEGYFNPFGDVAKHYYGRNMPRYLTQLKVGRPPGEVFDYVSVNTQLLAAILETATGESLHEYLTTRLWQPLGMEYPATWSVDSKRHQTEKAFCCLNARARDFAKFGRLYLHHGNWQGRQLVPEAWVERSTTFTEPMNRFNYTNHWWHVATSFPAGDSTRVVNDLHYTYTWNETEYIRQPLPDYFAEGVLGQFIYVHPERDLIIVRLGRKYGDVNWPGFFHRLSWRF